MPDNPATHTNLITNLFKDNTSKDITPARMRTLIESFKVWGELHFASNYTTGVAPGTYLPFDSARSNQLSTTTGTNASIDLSSSDQDGTYLILACVTHGTSSGMFRFDIHVEGSSAATLASYFISSGNVSTATGFVLADLTSSGSNTVQLQYTTSAPSAPVNVGTVFAGSSIFAVRIK